MIELVEYPVSTKNGNFSYFNIFQKVASIYESKIQIDKEEHDDEKGFKFMKDVYLIKNDTNSSQPIQAPRKKMKKSKK